MRGTMGCVQISDEISFVAVSLGDKCATIAL